MLYKKREIALHFEHGCGSLWACAWLRSAAGGEDGDGCGGRGHGGEPLAQERGHECERGGECGSGVAQAAGEWRSEPPHTTAPAAMSKAASIAAHGAARTVVQARTAKRGLRHGSRRFGPDMEDVCAPLGGAVAGGCGRRLRAFRALRRNWGVASARRVALQRARTPATAGRAGDAGCLRLLLGQQLCSGAAAGTAALGISPFLR